MLPTTNFRDHVDVLVLESTCALVLNSWRKVELSLVDCFGDQARRDRHELEELIRTDPRFGEATASSVRRLRKRRNEVAHEQVYLPSEEAKAFAYEAFHLLGVFGRYASNDT